MQQLNQFKRKKILVSKEFSSVSYNITFDALPNPYIPKKLEEKTEQLFNLCMEQPAEAISELKRLLEIYPDNAVLLNWLSGAYYATNNDQEAEKIVLQNYTLNPGYLFAKCAYAFNRMNKHESYDEIPTIFNHKFNLKDLYPERDVFHFGEERTFCMVMGLYFAHKQEFQTANLYKQIIHTIDPDHAAMEAIEAKIFMEQCKLFLKKAESSFRRKKIKKRKK